MDKNHINDLWHAVQAEADEVAFRQCFDYFYIRLVRFALTYVTTQEEAEELVSDIFVKLWNKKDMLDTIQDITSYLYAAVRNQCLNHLKKDSTRPPHISDNSIESFISGINNPSVDLEWKEIHARLERAIEGLPEQCRTVFILIREERFKYKEVAGILKISPRTVETHLNRAVRKLSKALYEFLNVTNIRK